MEKSMELTDFSVGNIWTMLFTTRLRKIYVHNRSYSLSSEDEIFSFLELSTEKALLVSPDF